MKTLEKPSAALPGTVIVRITGQEVAGWVVGDEIDMPKSIAAEYVSEKIGEIIPRRTKPAPGVVQKTLTELVEGVAAQNEGRQ